MHVTDGLFKKNASARHHLNDNRIRKKETGKRKLKKKKKTRIEK